MSEAVLDEVIEHIADGMSVDWGAINAGTLVAGDNRWLSCLRIINDVANFHRADALSLMTEMPTAISAPLPVVGGGVPEAWGKYKLANRVGAGSYGAVYRAWDSDLERDVAMKILHDRFGDTRLKDKLLKEGRALARIRHDNVVQVFGVEAHEDRVALCMEFVEGQTLDEVIRRGTLSAREAIGIGEDLCRALAAVHGAGYIHRDVKAKNVMRDARGRIVLMDFGTGRMADRPGAFGDRAGTPLYMAPEVLNGEPASPSSDVYSLGVLLYFLVSGQYPVDARTIDELHQAHANRQHRWLSERRPDLPVPFMQVVERAIALDPQERYSNPSELLSALAAIKVGPHPWLWRIAKPLIVLGVVLLGMTALGAMTSAMFNLAFGRADYVSETLLDYMVWGRRTSFPPLLILLFVVLVVTVLRLVRRLVMAMVPPARRLDRTLQTRLARLAHRFRLDEVWVLASWAVLLSTVATFGAIWRFRSLIVAVLTMPTASRADLAVLAPESVGIHNEYRWIFTFVVMFSVAVWYPVVRLLRKGQTLHWGLMAGGIVVTCMSLALLHFPYRILYFSRLFPFEAATFNSERCYIVAERGDDRLLFCPTLPPPRNRLVKMNDGTLTPLGIRESPFSHLSASAGSDQVAEP